MPALMFIDYTTDKRYVHEAEGLDMDAAVAYVMETCHLTMSQDPPVHFAWVVKIEFGTARIQESRVEIDTFSINAYYGNVYQTYRGFLL